MLAIPLLAISLAPYLRTSSAFSFTINNTPEQCTNLNISITGSGQPPYSAIVLPYGATPLSNNIEVREVIDVAFNGASTSTSFKLTYPENSQFVVVVSDSTGFGTGGASAAVQVQTGSSDSSCYGNSQASPPFTFSTTPNNQLVQCSSTRIWWDPSQTQGNVQFYGVIPGGQSFQINQGPLTSLSAVDYGFSWTVSVRAGATLVLVGGDNRGIGSAGWIQQNIDQSGNQSCLDASSPSSTAGSPAGGAYPTSSNGVGTGGGGGGNNNGNGGSGGKTGGNSSGSSKSNMAAIIGGAAGGGVIIAAIVLGVFLCLRRRRPTSNHHPVDLLQGHGQQMSPGPNHNQQFYRPESFQVPEAPALFDYGRPSYDPHQSTEASASTSLLRAGPDVIMAPSFGHQSYDPRQSMQTATTSSLLRSGTPEVAVASTVSNPSQTQKSSVPTVLRPVNIIHHDDAGTVDEVEPETIELPPAYSNLRNNVAP